MHDLPPHVSRLDPRGVKAARIVANRNGNYDSQNIVSVRNREAGAVELSVVLHHAENRERSC